MVLLSHVLGPRLIPQESILICMSTSLVTHRIFNFPGLWARPACRNETSKRTDDARQKSVAEVHTYGGSGDDAPRTQMLSPAEVR